MLYGKPVNIYAYKTILLCVRRANVFIYFLNYPRNEWYNVVLIRLNQGLQTGLWGCILSFRPSQSLFNRNKVPEIIIINLRMTFETASNKIYSL